MPDYIVNVGGSFEGHGEVAQRLIANGLNVNAMRPFVAPNGRSYITINQNGKPISIPINNAATLRHEEWVQYDRAVLQAARMRLSGVADLQTRNLTYGITNGLGTTVLQYEDVSDMSGAETNMDGVTPGKKDRIVSSIKYLPLPITHKDFNINARVLAASRNGSMPLDTTQAELASMKVAEQIETMLFQGLSSYSFGGGTIYGYCDFPSRNTVTLSENWDASGKTGAEIIDDVKSMKQAAISDRHYGPWVLYVPTAYETKLDEDYVANYPKTIRQRLLEIEGIQAVKVSDYLSANNVVLVEMNTTTVRLVSGLGITVVEWESEGKMVHHYKVMAIMVPQLRADQNGNCGIVHLAA